MQNQNQTTPESITLLQNSSSSSSYYPKSSSSSYSSLYQSHSPTNHLLQNTITVLEYQQLYNRYTTCIGYLTELLAESEHLQLENKVLRLTNSDLSNRIEALLANDRVLADFERLKIGSESNVGVSVTGGTRQLLDEFNRVEMKGKGVPKSISVRSKDYLDVVRSGREEKVHQLSVTQPVKSTQKICVPLQGAENDEEAVELDVFNQGMLKTELCNKWEETGACPYGDHCQFAHGIKELRPVIRHPRYKTELCRMVLAGEGCPYGHRCHFRHSLTEQERLMASQQPTR